MLCNLFNHLRWVKRSKNLPVAAVIVRKVLCTKYLSAWALPRLQVIFILSARVDRITCLFAIWSKITFRERIICVGFPYSLCLEKPLGLLYISASKKGRWSSSSVPMLNWVIIECSWGSRGQQSTSDLCNQIRNLFFYRPTGTSREAYRLHFLSASSLKFFTEKSTKADDNGKPTDIPSVIFTELSVKAEKRERRDMI
jgi:hypothetical protein